MIHHPHTNEEYDKLKTSDKLVVVKFGAEWCGPCRSITPQFKALAKKYAGTATFVHVDVDELEDLPDGEDVSGLPTFKFFKGDKLIDHFSGANAKKLKETSKKHAK